MHIREYYTDDHSPHEIGINGFTFKDTLPFTNDYGWIDAWDVKPLAYEIVHLLTSQCREKNGWWTGLKWDGLRLTEQEKICWWKPLKGIENGMQG